ncbi:MAG: DUF58 domain-containing protein [Phycisphaerae bacterium]
MTPQVSRFLRPDVLAGITGLELRARLVVEGFLSGQHRSPYRGYSVEFAEHREYVPGDDIRHIDWRVFGRADRFYIKQYEEETNLRTHLIVDCSASMRYPTHENARRMTKFEYAATLAASLAYLLIHQQDAVGLTLFDDRVRTHVPPAGNMAHLKQLTASLEAARVEHPTRVGAVFTDLAGRLRRRSLVVVISDLLADPDEVLLSLEQMRFSGHDVIVMHVLDEDERRFPFDENLLFEGLEAPTSHVLCDPRSLRTSYLSALERFIQRIRSACRNHRIDFVDVSTSDGLDRVLRRYLTARAAVRL